MARIVVISILFLAACDVGALPGFGPDGGGGGMDGSGGGNGCVDAVAPPPTAHLHTAGGTANAGMTCMMVGCHLAGGAGPTYTFAGTVYTSAAATAPKAGATVKITFGAMTLTAVTDDAGNFSGSQPITFPAKTLATSCPTVAPMVTDIVTGNGNCNNCHRPGGTTTPIFVQ